MGGGSLGTKDLYYIIYGRLLIIIYQYISIYYIDYKADAALSVTRGMLFIYIPIYTWVRLLRYTSLNISTEI